MCHLPRIFPLKIRERIFKTVQRILTHALPVDGLAVLVQGAVGIIHQLADPLCRVLTLIDSFAVHAVVDSGGEDFRRPNAGAQKVGEYPRMF